MVAEADAKAVSLFNAGQDADAVEYLTEFSFDIGRKLLRDWFKFFGQLFVKYRDGVVTTENKKDPVCGCATSSLPYADQWYDRIAADTGDRYILPQNAADRTTIPKKDLNSFR